MKPKETEPKRPFNKIDPKKIKVGDLMSITHYVKVKSALPKPTQREDGITVNGVDSIGEFYVNGFPLIESMSSADQFQEEQSVSKTKAAETLISSYGRPFTVCYEKQGSESKGDVGEERVLRGRLVEAEPLMGRSKVEDLDKPNGDRFRLVDHRTLKWLVVDGVKFKVKS